MSHGKKMAGKGKIHLKKMLELISPVPPKGSSPTVPPFSVPVCRAECLLRCIVVLQTAGWAAALWTRNGSALGDIALMQWGVAHSRILLGESVAAAILLLAALSLLFRAAAFPLLLLAGAALAEAGALVHFGGHPFSEHSFFDRALRYLTPLALVPLVWSGRSNRKIQGAAWILRCGLAVVFFSHGLQSFGLHPGFLDLIIGCARNLFGLSVREEVASTALRVIGTVDVAVAIWVLARPGRHVLAWMSFWGLITALARPLALGPGAYAEVLLRASHALAPIALGWLLRQQLEEGNVRTACNRSRSGSDPHAPKKTQKNRRKPGDVAGCI